MFSTYFAKILYKTSYFGIKFARYYHPEAVSNKSEKVGFKKWDKWDKWVVLYNLLTDF